MNPLSKMFRRPATSPVAWLETSDLADKLAGQSPPLVIDVRGPDEFAGALGHIDNAKNIPLDQISGHTTALLAEQRPLVLVCHTDRRSRAAAEHLRQAGAADVAVLRGGMVAWRSQT